MRSSRVEERRWAQGRQLKQRQQQQKQQQQWGWHDQGGKDAQGAAGYSGGSAGVRSGVREWEGWWRRKGLGRRCISRAPAHATVGGGGRDGGKQEEDEKREKGKDKEIWVMYEPEERTGKGG